MRPSLNISQKAQTTVLRSLASLAIVTVIVGTNLQLPFANSTTCALTLILAILGISTGWGFVEGVVGSVGAAVGFGYLLPPATGLAIDKPEDWLALNVFLVTSYTVSRLSQVAAVRVAESNAVRKVAELLMQMDRPNAALIVESLPALVETVFDRAGAAFLVRESGSLISGQRYSSATGYRGEAKVIAGGAILGTLMISDRKISPSSLEALAALVAMAIGRANSIETAVAAEELRQRDEFRNTLLAAIAHDFRTPLTAIKGAVTALQSQVDVLVDVSTHRELLDVALGEVNRMDRMVGEVIELGRIQATNLHLQRGAVELRRLVEEARREFGKDGERIEIHLPPNLPESFADADRIAEVFRQLLRNALLYSPPDARVLVLAEAREVDILVTIRDFGSGIGSEDLAKIFEGFYRGRQVPKGSGSGLGLMIARSLVNAHGGKIWVESHVGQGSAFSFTLQLATPAGNAA